MAKKNNPLTCPYCLTKLLEVSGHCVGVIVKCHHCGASVLADVDETGKMRLSADPNKAQEMPQAAMQKIEGGQNNVVQSSKNLI